MRRLNSLTRPSWRRLHKRLSAAFSLGEQIDQATEAGATKKVDALSQQAEELEKKLGPEYRTLFDALNDADPDSQEVKDILSRFDTLAESCPH
jgi:hypothetical protein